MSPTRRQFLRGALGAAGATAVGVGLSRRSGAATAPDAGAPPSSTFIEAALPTLPNPAESGIEHIVVVMMENRSFDHFFGWLPKANGTGVTVDLNPGSPTYGRQLKGPSDSFHYPDADKNYHSIYNESQLAACGLADQDHSFNGGRVQYEPSQWGYVGGIWGPHGAPNMSGFLLDDAALASSHASDPNGPQGNTNYSLSYYLPYQRPFMMNLALNYATCHEYFCSILGPTYPNRFFMHAAATDRLSNTSTTSTLPTIWDRLNQVGGPTGRYYFSDVPFLALWGQKYLPIAGHYAEFLADAQAGNLPNVSFVDPRFESEGDGTSNDDHPIADLRAGDSLLSEIFQAVVNGPDWESTALIINYDEWGGFFDHVSPVRVTPGVPGVDPDVVKGKVLTGLRVPCIVASPWTKGNPNSPNVPSHFYDHTSVLKLIEWRWGLDPVSLRDASTASSDPKNLATAFNFGSPDASVPDLPNLLPFVPESCAAGNPALGGGSGPSVPVSQAGGDTWGPLLASPLMNGWT